jgi:hypothetical protein
MKKDEVIEKLLSKGVKQEELVGLKVSELKAMLEEETKGEDCLIVLDKLQQGIDSGEYDTKTDPPSCDDPLLYNSTTVDSREQKNKTNNAISLSELSDPPRPSDSGWTQYVMGLFMDDELEGQNPRLEGLRRVAELLLGEVIEERSELVSAPTMENSERACSKASIVFADGRVYEALADACPSNCTKDFAIYPVAMSDTRAKGRAYRAALRLKRVVSAEEIGVDSGDKEDINKNIQTGQLTAIRLLSDRSNISIKKLLDDLEISCSLKDNVVDLKSLKYSEALVVLNRLNSLRTENYIPEKLKK